MTEKPELEVDIKDPIAPPSDLDPTTVHNELLNDPHYAVHLHERQLERLTTFVEELAMRLIKLEEHIHGVDPNPGLDEYPEVKQ